MELALVVGIVPCNAKDKIDANSIGSFFSATTTIVGHHQPRTTIAANVVREPRDGCGHAAIPHFANFHVKQPAICSWLSWPSVFRRSDAASSSSPVPGAVAEHVHDEPHDVGPEPSPCSDSRISGGYFVM